MKKLIIYGSQYGSTRRYAERLAKKSDLDRQLSIAWKIYKKNYPSLWKCLYFCDSKLAP